jgi:predicted nucleic acid-binding protein
LIACADTSFLVSLYILDANSAAAAAKMKRAALPIFFTALGEVELTNAFSLRLFRKELLPSTVKASRALVAEDIAGGVLLLKQVESSVYERAKKIARVRTPLLGTRTIDILQVALALALHADTFYTFDRNQARLARAEGLRVP